MKTSRIIAGALGMVLALALAAPATSQETGSAAPALARGAQQAREVCAACHGDQGQGMAASGFPRLAGLNEAYLKAQLEHFQQDRRKNAVMAPMAKPLSAEEIEALAAYYASLPAPTTPDPSAPSADAALVSAGEALVRYGRWSQDIPACVSCHGDALGGLGTAFPALTGQPAAYIKASLTQWKTGERSGDPNALMGSVARRMSAADIDAAAAYLATLPTTAGVKP